MKFKPCPKRQEAATELGPGDRDFRGEGADPEGVWVCPLQSNAQHPGTWITRKSTSNENPIRSKPGTGSLERFFRDVWLLPLHSSPFSGAGGPFLPGVTLL